MKIGKKIFALTMALLVIFSCVSLSVSAADKKTNYPIISVPGFMSSDLVSDQNDPDSKLYWPVQGDNGISAATVAVPALAKFIIRQDWDEFGAALEPIVKELFAGLLYGKDGEPLDESGAYREYPTKEEIKFRGEVTFRYDWRRDPIEVAKELDDYINYIIKVSGQKKVSISCHSLGGVITLTYLALYGNSKIHGVAFDSAAIYGESFTGDLFTGKLVCEGKGILYNMECIMKGTELELLVNSFLEILYDAGLMDIVAAVNNDLVDKIRPYIYQALSSIFVSWPSMWTMVPDDMIDDAMDYIFSEIYDKDDPDAKKLMEKVENYNEKVRSKKAKTLLETDKKSRIMVITRYGFVSVANTPSWNVHTDGTVDVASSSFGATTAFYGETLSEEYLKTANKKYISPDKMIDASTCLFPEKTWFVRNLLHHKGCDGIDMMIRSFFDAEKEVTVDTYEKYPRFLKVDAETDDLVADENYIEMKVPEGDIKDKIIFFAQTLLDTIKIILKR